MFSGFCWVSPLLVFPVVSQALAVRYGEAGAAMAASFKCMMLWQGCPGGLTPLGPLSSHCNLKASPYPDGFFPQCLLVVSPAKPFIWWLMTPNNTMQALPGLTAACRRNWHITSAKCFRLEQVTQPAHSPLETVLGRELGRAPAQCHIAKNWTSETWIVADRETIY